MTERLLSTNDPAPFEWHNPHHSGELLITCDHGGREFPGALGSLGLAPSDTERHIAWDIGALDLAKELSNRLRSPLVAGTYSRLVVDLNRFPEDPTSIAQHSDQTAVPGNSALSATAKQQRVDEIFTPYHSEIRQHLANARAVRREPIIIFVHSFTPHFERSHRPWPVGLLSNEDRRLTDPLLHELGAVCGLNVGDNQPYSGRDPYSYSSAVHAESDGLRHTVIEVRQDLIADEAGVLRWAEILSGALRGAIKRMDPTFNLTDET
ncbi:MAG: N-formylglutamate amidohydrolase [Gammaproteobacteria bacterium]|nr:N-formylglutamate amidohydrolase [Gammaproteobacteria bacterium]